MLRKGFIVAMASLFFTVMSCVPKFAIQPLDDQFTDPGQPHGFIGRHNRLSKKSSGGGVHIDNKGVYIDPYIFRYSDNGEIKSVGFYIKHVNFADTPGFDPIQKIIFITDKGERIVLNVESGDTNFGIDMWGKIMYTEIGISRASLDDFRILANAKWLAAKVVGRRGAQTYDKDEISRDFLANLKSFYNSAINN